MKRQITTGVSSKMSPHFIISQQGLTLNLWKKTLRYLPSLWIVGDGIHKIIIYGKVKLSRSWPFYIILNIEVEPVNRGYAEQAFANQ